MQKTKSPNYSGEKIVIRGTAYDCSYFAPTPIDELTIKNILPHIQGIGDIAKKGCSNIDDLIRNSPLIYIEGLLRYQLKRLDDDLAGIALGLDDLGSFDNVSELLHEEDAYSTDPKAVFLFDFLKDIVFLSHYPETINQSDLDKIALNMRALFFLVEPQLNGSIRSNDDAFEFFAFNVWMKLGGKKISGRHFFKETIKIIEKHQGYIEFYYRKFQWEKSHKYVATIDSSGEGPKIKITCETQDVKTGRPRGLGQINNIWRAMQIKFIEGKKIISGKA